MVCVYSPASCLKMIWRFQKDPQISRGLSPLLGIRKSENGRGSHKYLSVSFKTETRRFTVAFKGHESHTLVQNLLLFKPCYNSLTATKQSISSSVLQYCGTSGLKMWFCEICVLAAGGSVSVKSRLESLRISHLSCFFFFKLQIFQVSF